MFFLISKKVLTSGGKGRSKLFAPATDPMSRRDWLAVAIIAGIAVAAVAVCVLL